MGRYKTDGGSKKHAVIRLQKQYKCSLNKKEIKRILRESKEDIKNGRYIIPEEIVRKLKITLPLGRDLVGIVVDGTIITIIDN